MTFKNFCKKYQNLLISLLAIAAFGGFVCLRYDLIYELNDDTVIRNLLSGTYTGTPTAMNNQMMFILSAAISCLYKIIPSVQWFDIFLIVCQYFCIWVILYRIITFCEKTTGKIIISVIYLLFLFAFLLEHFVLATYTVTSGILAVTAIFRFVTENEENLYRNSLISIVLAVIAFCIRSELLIMLLPFICVAGMYRWGREEKIFTADNFKKYFGIFGTLIILLLVVFVTDNIAYSSQEWKDFRSFFDARTTVYDYTYIPDYDTNKAFYDSNSISKEQYLLLECYDYALDEDINTEMMNSIAEYAKSTGYSIAEKLYKAVFAYKNQVLNNIGTKYHTIALSGYIIIFLALNRNNKFRLMFTTAVTFFVRSVVWLYLHGQGRTPDRITHPLYWAEFLLLMAIFVVEISGVKFEQSKRKITAGIIILAISAVFVSQSYSVLNSRYNKLYEKSYTYEAVHSYCIENEDNFYFTPIFSLAIYPEMVFDGSEEPENFDLLGGWLVKSPAHREKIKNYNMQSVGAAVLNNDNVYIIQHKDYVSFYTTYPFEWLTGYYASKGIDVEITETDTIIDNIGVYKVEIKD